MLSPSDNFNRDWGLLSLLSGHTHLSWTSTALAAIDAKMTVQDLNWMGDLRFRWKSRSLLPSLNMILEFEEDVDNNLPRTTMLLPSTHQLGPGHTPGKRRYMWFCCQCGDGPSDVDYVSNCTDCDHPRCRFCGVAPKKTRVLRIFPRSVKYRPY